MSPAPCPACGGSRLRKEALAVRFRDRTSRDVGALTVGALVGVPARRRRSPGARSRDRRADPARAPDAASSSSRTSASATSRSIAAPASLSGGESQRIRLATQVGSNLRGILYVLDEPSIGLHPRDNRRLLETLERLRDAGNTVIVVEHDRETMQASNFLVDVGPARAATAARSSRPGTIAGPRARAALDHGRVPLGPRARSSRRPARRRPRRPPDRRARRAREQPQEPRRRPPARHVHRRHRRLRLGQDHARQRRAQARARARAARRAGAAGRARRDRRHREPRQGDRDRPVADRPHAAQQPRDVHEGVRRDPRALREPARVEGARLPARALLVQREGRPLRGVRRRRREDRRDAVPRRRRGAVRRLRRPALQPRDARGPYRFKSINDVLDDDDRGGARVLREPPEDPARPRDARPDRARLRAARAAVDDALGRRGAAREARDRAPAAADREDALHPRRADDGPPLRRRAPPDRGAAGARRRRQHRRRDRAQPRGHPLRGLDPRPRPRGRRGGRRGRLVRARTTGILAHAGQRDGADAARARRCRARRRAPRVARSRTARSRATSCSAARGSTT